MKKTKNMKKTIEELLIHIFDKYEIKYIECGIREVREVVTKKNKERLEKENNRKLKIGQVIITPFYGVIKLKDYNKGEGCIDIIKTL